MFNFFLLLMERDLNNIIDDLQLFGTIQEE